jgi:hypothetical protein
MGWLDMTAHDGNRREQDRGVIAIADAGHASDVVTIRRRYNGPPRMNAGAAPMGGVRWR